MIELNHRLKLWGGVRRQKYLFNRYEVINGWVDWTIINQQNIFLFFFDKASINFMNPSSNNMLSIQLFFWLRYRQGKCFICLKHQGFLDLPVTNYGNFSPTILAAVIPVWRSLLCLPPTQFSFFRCRDLFGWAQ